MAGVGKVHVTLELDNPDCFKAIRSLSKLADDFMASCLEGDRQIGRKMRRHLKVLAESAKVQKARRKHP